MHKRKHWQPSQLINYALEQGYANTILFKEPSNIRIHRSRVIHLYEADYNLVLGLEWRAALYKAEAKKQLHEGQFSSLRPRRRNDIDPVMLEELPFEASRVSQKTTACYGLIIPNLATIVSQQHGVHKQVTLTNARTLQKASYHIRTEMGLPELVTRIPMSHQSMAQAREVATPPWYGVFFWASCINSTILTHQQLRTIRIRIVIINYSYRS